MSTSLRTGACPVVHCSTKDESTSVAIDGDVVVCHHVALFGLCCVVDHVENGLCHASESCACW